MKKIEKITPNRKTDIELMRIMAVFFVIFNHTEERGFFLFSLYEWHSIQFWIYLMISVFCKFSVPLFFMITGALMLKKDSEPLSYLWKHRVIRMVLVLIFWSFFYYIIEVYKGRQILNLKIFLLNLYEYNWNFSYWYLYAYIPLLISLPLLRKISNGLSDENYIYMISLFLVFNSVLPTLQYLCGGGHHNLNSLFRIDWLESSILINPLVGYFLQFRANEFWNRRRILILWCINICLILFTCYLTYIKVKMTGICDEKNSQSFHSSFALINSITIFVTCQFVYKKRKFCDIFEKLVNSIGGCTFGIYLLHVFYIRQTVWLWEVLREQLYINYMLSAFIYCIIVFMFGYVSTLILKRIPILKKIV